MSPSIEQPDLPQPPEEPSEAVKAQLDGIKARFNVLLNGYFHDSDAGTPIYDQLRKEYDEQEKIDEIIGKISSRRLQYGTFI